MFKREICLFFIGNNMTFYIDDAESEKQWDSILTEAVNTFFSEGKVIRLISGGTVFFVSSSFIGWQIRNVEDSEYHQRVKVNEKLLDLLEKDLNERKREDD